MPVPSVRDGDQGLEGQVGLAGLLWRLTGVQGKVGDVSEAVTEGPAGCAQEHGEGQPLTPGLGAHPPTTFKHESSVYEMLTTGSSAHPNTECVCAHLGGVTRKYQVQVQM